MGSDIAWSKQFTRPFFAKLTSSCDRIPFPERAMSKPTSALVVQEFWATRILNGTKTWELRGRSTRKRGPISIAISGTSKLYGQVNLVDCDKVAERQEDGSLKSLLLLPLSAFHPMHMVTDLNIIGYPAVYAWILAEPLLYDSPRVYTHTHPWCNHLGVLDKAPCYKTCQAATVDARFRLSRCDGRREGKSKGGVMLRRPSCGSVVI